MYRSRFAEREERGGRTGGARVVDLLGNAPKDCCSIWKVVLYEAFGFSCCDAVAASSG
jgi:hypothetical protein